VYENKRTNSANWLAITGAAALLFFLLSACELEIHQAVKGSGIEKASTRRTASFTRVDLKGSMRVAIVVGEPLSVIVRGDDNLIGRVRTRVKGETLTISNDRLYRSKIGLSVAIHVPTLTAIDLSGSGTIEVRNVQGTRFIADLSGSGEIALDGKPDRLDLDISGSGDIQVDRLEARKVYGEISGSGEITANGTTERLDISIPGSGEAQLERLIARDVQVDISGSGDARVWAGGSLDAEISGSGDIEYAGNPRRVVKDVSGSGEINAH
jgi:hypothetical protein